MSNSSLVAHTKISPNRTTGRTHTIDTITIHCVVGQCSVETLGNVFARSSLRASSNYGIGADGRVGMYVEEKDRSWCSSSSANDNRAVTIECASDTTAPYAVNDTVYASLIKLVADICRRNGIKKLVWSTDKNTRVNHLNGCNMTVHRDYANKSCPGDYLYNRMGDIAAKVNALLGASTTTAPATSAPAATTPAATTPTKTEDNKVTLTVSTLKKGSTGAQVKTLQRLLYAMGYTGADGKRVGIDGDFGSNTEYAVKKYQSRNGLVADGIVGAATWGVLIGE